MSDFWANRSVLVTGAMGFVGSHLCLELLKRGAKMRATDLTSTPSASWRALGVRPKLVPWGLDVRDANATRRIVAGARPSVVFHLAGMSLIDACERDPVGALETNVGGTWNVLGACHARRKTIAAVVVASSNHIYGHTGPQAVTEDAPLRQQDVYGTSKICADMLTQCYRRLGVPAAALRHVNAYGPADPHVGHLIPSIILARQDTRRLIIHGDGTAIKGYLYVADVISAYLILAERMVERGQARTAYNATDPTATMSVRELVEFIYGPVPDRTFRNTDPSQNGYEERLDASALRELGWKPAWSLAQGLSATASWYEQHGRQWLR